MKMARKMKRNLAKKARQGDALGVRDAVKAEKAVLHATIKETMMADVKAAEMRDRMSMIFLASAGMKFRLSAKTRDMLRRKMGIHYLCWKDGTVTFEDMRRILLEESGVYGKPGLDISEYCIPTEGVCGITLAKMETFNAITAIFMLCLLDGLGYKKKRMKGLFLYVASIMSSIEEQKLSFDDLRDYLKSGRRAA